MHKALRMISAMAAGVIEKLWSAADLTVVMEASLPKPSPRWAYKSKVANQWSSTSTDGRVSVSWQSEKLIAKELRGRLLDNHAIYNVAFRLTEFRSVAFYNTVRAVRDIAFQHVVEVPNGVPVIMTSADFDNEWGNENWDAIIRLARKRGSKLFVAILDCSPEENARRAQSPDRDYLGKLRDPSILLELRTGRSLLSRDADQLLRIDTSLVGAETCAERIIAWVHANCNARQIQTGHYPPAG
jgi:hypothetical protein